MKEEDSSISIKNQEQIVGQFYDKWSPRIMDKWKAMEITSSLHYGYHTLKTTSLVQSNINMNDYVAKLLKLNNEKDVDILDAGCGIGGTSVYFSKRFPKVNLTGITISPKQVTMAEKLAKKMDVTNAKFKIDNYMQTSFSDNSFDKIFALESFSYCPNYKKFLDEMYRILKPGGILAVVDVFRTSKNINSFMQKIYNNFSVGYGNAVLTNIKDYENYLRKKGFNNIIIENITWNVAPSVLLWSFAVLSSLLSKKLKISGSKNNNLRCNKIECDQYGNIYAFIVGACGIIKYMGTSATKKE